MIDTANVQSQINSHSITAITRIPSKELKMKSILFIDDDYVNFLYFKELLSNTNYSIDRAISLSQAIQKITDYNNIDLIILSCSLPENFNYFALRILKTKFPDLPVISFMDSQLREMESDLINAGSEMCISRYTDQDHFVGAIYDVLEKSEYLK